MSAETDFPEVKPAEERAAERFEELDGLPQNNRFSEIINDLRSEDESWGDIHDELEPVFRVVEEVAYEEGLKMSPEWEITIVVGMSDGNDVEKTTTVNAETAEKAESKIDTTPDESIDSSKTKQVGVGKFS